MDASKWLGNKWSHSPSFNLNQIDSLSIYSYRCFGTWKHTAKIRFKNGSDIAEKEFEGKTFQDVLEQVFSFLNVRENPNTELLTIRFHNDT